MAMIKICEHIKDNGSTCGSPALTGYSFCFFHQRLRLPRHRPGDFEYKLPILDTPHSILMAIQHITQATLDGVLEDRRARLVLSALRLAKSTLQAMNKEEGKNKVNDVGTGKNVLAEEKANVGTGALARATRAELAVSGEARHKPSQPTTIVPALSSRGPLLAEGSAFAPVTTDAGAAAAAPEGSPRREPWVSITSTPKAPAEVTDKKPPLSAHQLKLMKKIIRRGPSHPQFKLAARLLDRHIVEGH